MIKLLVIADDFTGALDTGVQFAQKGIRTKVTMKTTISKEMVEDVDVLVVDSETRHKKPEEAAETVSNITKQAAAIGTEYFYKKTDSALRGNIGAELEAILRASGHNILACLPAFPKMNRLTKGGIQYIDNIPVSESVFAADPFNPVVHSSVKEIIVEQSELEIQEGLGSVCLTENPLILVLDADSQSALKEAGRQCIKDYKIRVFAGCAGFAEELAGLLGIETCPIEKLHFQDKITVLCGSVNPISVAQVNDAIKNGFVSVRFAAEQILQKNFCGSKKGQEYLHNLKEQVRNDPYVILSSNFEEKEETILLAKKMGLSEEEMRSRIAENLGASMGWLYRNTETGTVMVIGGDTLEKFMKEMDISELTPYCELFPGVVLSEFYVRGEKRRILTKSGGFGEVSLLTELKRGFEIEGR